MPQIRIDDDDYRILKRITRRFDLTLADLIGALVNDIEDWDEFVEEHWNICPHCYLANDADVDFCEECGEELE